MPTSSGHDRANYNTTFGFSRGAYARVNKNRYANLYTDTDSNNGSNHNNNSTKKQAKKNGNGTPPKMTSTTVRKSRDDRPRSQSKQRQRSTSRQRQRSTSRQRQRSTSRQRQQQQQRSTSRPKQPQVVPPIYDPPKTSNQLQRRRIPYDDERNYLKDQPSSLDTHRPHEQQQPQQQQQASYVKIQDPNLREIVQELVKSEQESANDDPNLITQIDHKGYSLFLSKNGINPFKTDFTSTGTTTRRSRFPSENNLFYVDSNPAVNGRSQPAAAVVPILKKQQQAYHPSNSRNLFRRSESPGILHYEYQDVNGDNYEIRELNSRNNGELSSRLHLDHMTDIPVEVTRLIQQDMNQNPLGDEERNYRIIINRSSSKPGQQPQAIRVKARNINGKKILEYLPEIESDTIRQVYHPQPQSSSHHAPLPPPPSQPPQTTSLITAQHQQQQQMMPHPQQHTQIISQTQAFKPTSPQYVIKPTATAGSYQDANKYLQMGAGGQQTFFYNEQSGPIAIRPISPGNNIMSNPPNNYTGYTTNVYPGAPPPQAPPQQQQQQQQFSTASFMNQPQHQPPQQQQQMMKSKPKQFFGNVNED